MNKFVCIITFLFFQNELQQCTSVSVVITPTSVNASLGSTTEFTCNTTDEVSHIYFWVNGTEASNNTGFNESLHHNGTTRTMKVDALRNNNNTNISCKAILQDDTVCISSNSTLMIQGILDGVGDLMATIMDGSNVSLTWAPPYSLDNVPINGYNIITSDGDDITVNTPYHILTSSDPDPCNITTVSVGAINDVGTSQYNNVSFYYQKAPREFFFNGNLTFKESQLMLNLYINVTFLCIGDEILSVAVDPNGNIINYTNITIYSQHQLVNEYLPVLPIEWNTFIVNLTLINRAGKSNKTVKFGSFIDINSSVINCSTISVSWERPSVSDGVNIHNYTLLIYDDVSHTLVDRVSVNGSVTSYQFEDDDLFHHRYTYVIYGNNELGQSNYSNRTFSYSRVPKSAKDNTTCVVSPISNNKISLYFMIPIVLECTGEVPEMATIDITCDNSTLIYNQTYPVEYANHPMNITRNISVELTQRYQRCSLRIVFSNSAGHSEPFMLEIDIPEVDESLMIPLLLAFSLLLIVVLIFVIIVVILFYFIKRKKVICDKSKLRQSTKKKTVPLTSISQESTTTDEGVVVVYRRSSADSDKPKPVTMTGFGRTVRDDNGLAETEENREMPSTKKKKQNSQKIQKKKNKFRKSKYKPGEAPTTEKGNDEFVNEKSKTTSDYSKRSIQSIGAGSGIETGANIPYQEGDSQQQLIPDGSNKGLQYT